MQSRRCALCSAVPDFISWGIQQIPCPYMPLLVFGPKARLDRVLQPLHLLRMRRFSALKIFRVFFSRDLTGSSIIGGVQAVLPARICLFASAFHPAMQSSPLLGAPSAGRQGVSRRTVAAMVAALSAVGAVVVGALMVGGPSALLQRGVVKLAPVKGMQPLQAVGGKARQGTDQVYYVPMKSVKASPLAQLSSKAAAAQPVVYYYMPEKEQHAGMHVAQAHHMLADDNATAAGGDKKDEKLVCSTENIKALHAPAQAAWDACKALKDYKQPNEKDEGAAAPADAAADAGAADEAEAEEEEAARRRRRRLLGWVWEPKNGEKKTHVPTHGPEYYTLKLSEADRAHVKSKQFKLSQAVHPVHPVHPQILADNATDAGAKKEAVKTFEECQKAAVEDVCAKLASCPDPVCDNYYNEPEIEALCGMCTMAPLGCFAGSAEVGPGHPRKLVCCMASRALVRARGRRVSTFPDTRNPKHRIV